MRKVFVNPITGARTYINDDASNIRRRYEPIKKDVLITISSYNRITKLRRLLKQLFNQETKYSFKVFVMNDGSTKGKYDKLKEQFPIVLIKNNINGGKRNYWNTMSTLFKQLKGYEAKAVLQIDDDFILADNFIDKIMINYINQKKINRKLMAISYHLTECVERWRMGENWIDGGTVFDFNFIKAIGYEVEQISERRWDEKPELSSGVWERLSKMIRSLGGEVYKLPHSLALHDGNKDSKHNYSARKNVPINTINFKK